VPLVRRAIVLLTLFVAFGLAAHPSASSNVTDLELTIGTGNFKFEVNGTSRFLVFVSYFDAMDQTGSVLTQDFEDLKSYGADGVRIMANWWEVTLDGSGYPDPPYSLANDTLCDSSGNLRPAELTTLLGVLDTAKDEGLLVDLTFSAETVSGLNLSEYTDCIEDLAQELENGGSAYKHVLIDLQNEYNKSSNGPTDGRPLTEVQVAAVVSAVKAIESDRLVTASISSAVLSQNADDDADDADIDILAWHEPRVDGYWNSTVTNVGNLDNAGLPVYLQEPERRDAGNTTWTIADNWATNVYNAKNGNPNADAWTFHNGGTFALDGGPTLLSRLFDEEEDFLECLSEALSSGTCSSSPAPAPNLNPRDLLEILLTWLSPRELRHFGARP
jgi:hypothetical protein